MPNDQHLGGCSPSSPNALNLTIDDKCEHWLISLPNDKQVHQMLTKFTKWSTTSVPNTYQVYQMLTKFAKWSQVYQMRTKFAELLTSLLNAYQVYQMINDRFTKCLPSLLNDQRQIYQMLTKITKWSTIILPNTYQVNKFANLSTSLPNAYQVGAEITDSLLNEIDDLSSRFVLRNGVSLEDHNTHFVWRKTWKGKKQIL